MRVFKILLALPVIALMIGFAKMTQYSAVDAFGSTLGPNIASLVGAGPVIALYDWAAKRFPKLNTFGLSRG